MSIALPTQIADAVSSAASTGKEVAGTLLHEASLAAEHAAEATSAKARNLMRSARADSRSARHRPRKLLTLLALGGAVWAALAARARFQSSSNGVRTDRYGATPAPVDHERNGTVTSHNTDKVKGRVKEAAGALTDNDELKNDGKRDQTAASAKQAVDKAKDKVDEGIDAIKDKVNRN